MQEKQSSQLSIVINTLPVSCTGVILIALRMTSLSLHSKRAIHISLRKEHIVHSSSVVLEMIDVLERGFT